MSEYLKLTNKKDKVCFINVSTVKKCVVFLLVLFLVIITDIATFAADNSNAENEEFQQKRVLFISSYDSSFPTFFEQLDGLKKVLNEEDYQLDIEYMDTKRFFTEENLLNFDERLTYKLSILETYDAIVVGDDNALQYAMDNKNRLFTQVPIVFLGINDIDRAEEAYALGGIIGVVEMTSIKENLDLAIDLQENANRLLIVTDQSVSGQGELKQILELKDSFDHLDFDVFDLTNKSYDELSQELRLADNQTILLMLSAYTDVKGYTMSFYEYLDFIEYYASIPIFHLYDFGIGQGVLGGIVVNYTKQGEVAGELVKEVINNGDLLNNKLIVDDSTNSSIFDYELIEKYNLDKSLLPIDTLFINQPESFIDKNREMILASAAIVSFMFVVICLLLINIQRRKQVETTLQKNNEELSALYEEMIAINKELESAEEDVRLSNQKLSLKNQDLEESEQRYKNVFDLSHSGMWERDILTDELYITNDWYLNLFNEKGYQSLEDLNAESIMDLFYTHIDGVQLSLIKSKQISLREGLIESYSVILHCCKKGDKPLFIEEKGKSVYNKNGELRRIIGSHTNITASVLYEQKLESFAYKDQLTSIHNRIILEESLNTIIVNNTNEIVSGSVILIDVDNFKFINNTYGHEIGDELLIKIANRLDEAFGSQYTLGRISGDEFVLICENVHKQEDLEQLANDIVLLFDQRFTMRERLIYITISAGISVYPENGVDLDTLLNRCNSAVHDAKSKGKNQFEFYDISMNETMENKIYIQNNLREAMVNERFELFYQPIYNVKKDKISGFEALIRWKDEQRGYIPPLEFIVVAEKMGLINKLGEWVIKEACKFVKYLTTSVDEDLYISVNVSSVQLLQKDFVQTVTSIIEGVGIDFSGICIEITETALMQSFEKNIDKLLQLRKRGIRISLDDFGTGYSSLNYLRRLPVDMLKIDKSFIDEIISSKDGRDLTEGIILLAQKMGIYVVAEGIEESEQLRYLKHYKCDGIQGYLISRPMEKNKVKAFYDNFDGAF